MKDTRFFKFLIFVNAAVPVVLLGYDAWQHKLGANPVNFSIRTTGMAALIFITLSLVVTPLRKITGQSWLISARRTLGLYAFFYAALHFAIFFGLDQSLSLRSTGAEIVKRPYLLVGMLGVTLMAPLAVTSTNKMIQRLGTKRWQQLHRLAYVAAIAGVVHYYMLVKADVRLPVAFAVTLGVLFLYRIVAHYLNLRAKLALSLNSAKTSAPTSIAKRKFWKGQLRLARTFDETPAVRTFRFVPVSGNVIPFDFKPGQYLNVSFTVGGKKVNRSYSIASSPTRNSYVEITVKREAMGVASGYLHTSVKVGDVIDVSGPAGSFTFDGTEANSIVLIGAGVGITPLMSKIRALTDRAWPGAIFLIYSLRTEADVIFRDELEYLQERFANLHVCITLTRPAGTGWTGRTGRIDAELIRQFVPDFASRRFHLCGPNEMTAGTVALLHSMGVPDAQIAFESFTPGGANQSAKSVVEQTAATSTPQSVTQSVGQNSVTVEFSESGKSAALASDQTILDAAESVGVNIPFDCRAGICGTCKVKLLRGNVTMESEDALDASDRAKGLVLACQAHAIANVAVVA